MFRGVRLRCGYGHESASAPARHTDAGAGAAAGLDPIAVEASRPGATVFALLLVACVGYQVLWGNGLPSAYCESVSTLDDTLQRAADGSISNDELASKLSEVSADLERAGTIDPAMAGTEAPAEIEKLHRSVAKAGTAAQTGLGLDLALEHVRRDLSQAPRC